MAISRTVPKLNYWSKQNNSFLELKTCLETQECKFVLMGGCTWEEP